MSFYTAINCMDGRVQQPVLDYLRERFGVDHVDMITEPGPNRILAEGEPAHLVESIVSRLRISVEQHGSVGVAIVGTMIGAVFLVWVGSRIYAGALLRTSGKVKFREAWRAAVE